MIREQGMGRTRLKRFAAITVPAAVASVGLGVAMLQGMVAATLSSAGGFNLQTDLTAQSLKVRAGATEVGTTGSGEETIYAETTGAVADGLAVETPKVALPFGLANVYLTISSNDNDITLGNVALNAATLETDGATLAGVNLGVAQSSAGFTSAGQAPPTGYSATGFALTSGSASLPGVDSKAYAITLSTLSLDDLRLAVHAD